MPFVPSDKSEWEYPFSPVDLVPNFKYRIKCVHKEHNSPEYSKNQRVKWICPNCGMESFMSSSSTVFIPKQKGF